MRNESEIERRKLRSRLTENVADVVGKYNIDSETFDIEIIYDSDPVDIMFDGIYASIILRRSVINYPGVFRIDGEERGMHFVTDVKTGIYQAFEGGINRLFYIDEVFDKFARPNFEDVHPDTYLTNKNGGIASKDDLKEAIALVRNVKRVIKNRRRSNPSTNI